MLLKRKCVFSDKCAKDKSNYVLKINFEGPSSSELNYDRSLEWCFCFTILQKQRCRRYASAFEEFLSKDHEKSMSMLEKAEREAKLTEEISAQRIELAKQLGQSRLDVYIWEESWRLVKMCQLFLQRVSPAARKITRHDWFQRAESRKSFIFAEITSDLFGRYKMLDEDASLEDLIGNGTFGGTFFPTTCRTFLLSMARIVSR